MTRIGLVTIGQSPRDDLISEIRAFIKALESGRRQPVGHPLPTERYVPARYTAPRSVAEPIRSGRKQS